MRIRSNDTLINKVQLFSRKMPSTQLLFGILLVVGIIAGVITSALINYNSLGTAPNPVIVNGILTGILVIMLPTLITIMAMKLVKRYVKLKYMFFVSLIGAVAYGIFIILSAAIYHITNNFSLANAVVLVGDASIFAWWFFVTKIMLGMKKRSVLLSVVQPLFNILVYLAASNIIFTFAVPLNVLLIKLGAGIAIFVVISYLLLYIFDAPLKKNLGFGGIDAFSQFVQNWLFDIDLTVGRPLGSNVFGIPTDINVQTLVFKNKINKIKTILFAPEVHYGPVGTMGGSNFPYLLERHSAWKYKAPAFIMHSTVNEDYNPISSSQISMLRDAFDNAIAKSRPLTKGRDVFTYSQNTFRNATISALSMNKLNLVTFTRAPKVTEDIAPEASRLFKELLEDDGGDTIMIDAHNSRYESAPADELEGVKPNSIYMNEYIHAIKGLKEKHKTKKIKVGVASVDIYDLLDGPADLAPGNLNVIVFVFNGFRHAMLQFNANNMIPSMRNAIIRHAREKHRIGAEVYTTDTHYVNSLERSASNVLGRTTGHQKIMPFVEKALKAAMANAEIVDIYYRQDTIKDFPIWGPDVRERAFAVINSVMSLARILVPTIVAAGFIIASWIISLV